MRSESEKLKESTGKEALLKVRSLSVTALMIGFVLIASSAVTWHINTMERQNCFEYLEEEVDEFCAH